MLTFIARFRRFFLFAGVFSLVINLLLIVPAVYMLQVFDRVMMSRSQETLVMLTVFTVVALVVMAALDFVRSQLLARGGVALDKALGPIVLREMLTGQSRPTPSNAMHALRDVSILRAFLAGTPILALFDIPWIPVYIVVISLFHPLLGLVALVGAVILLIVTIANERLSRAPLEAMQAQSRKASHFVDLSLRNAESIAAMGMAPGVSGELGDASPRGAHLAARVEPHGLAGVRRDQVRAPDDSGRGAGGRGVPGHQSRSELGRDDRRHHPVGPGPRPGRRGGGRLEGAGGCEKRLRSLEPPAADM